MVRPLREKCNAAVKGDLHEILLSSLPKCTVASTGVSNMLRRFSAVPNIGRSIARVILGLGNIVLGVRNSNPGAVCVRTDNGYAIATNSVGASSSIRVLGPSRLVTALSRNTGLDVRVAYSENENCISTREGGRVVGPIVNIVTVSSVCAPILGIGCAIRGAHMKRVASCSGLSVRV